MKAFIQKHESIFRGIAIFFLLFADLNLVRFTISLLDSNPFGGFFIFVIGFFANIYFHYLYTNKG